MNLDFGGNAIRTLPTLTFNGVEIPLYKQHNHAEHSYAYTNVYVLVIDPQQRNDLGAAYRLLNAARDNSDDDDADAAMPTKKMLPTTKQASESTVLQMKLSTNNTNIPSARRVSGGSMGGPGLGFNRAVHLTPSKNNKKKPFSRDADLSPFLSGPAMTFDVAMLASPKDAMKVLGLLEEDQGQGKGKSTEMVVKMPEFEERLEETGFRGDPEFVEVVADAADN
jgi:hypothetical protein